MLEPGGSGGRDGGEEETVAGAVCEEGDGKKKAAESKILSYYQALTAGCGDVSCTNANCVTSGQVSL